MSTGNKIAVKEAIELLNQGHTLTQPGHDLNTLRKVGNTYEWKGRRDKEVTILEENDLATLIKAHTWVIDLL